MMMYIKTHGHVSVDQKDMRAHQCVIYATSQVADFSLYNSKTIMPNLHFLMSSYRAPYILNVKGIVPAVPEI